MTPVTLGEMLRLGGMGAYLSAVLGAALVVLVVVGFVLAAARKKGALRTWGWLVVVAGFICAGNGAAGTIAGLTRIAAAASAAGSDAATAGLLAQGVYEVLYNVSFGFGFAFLAAFGLAAVMLVAKRDT